jgi:four helix bundle protein
MKDVEVARRHRDLKVWRSGYELSMEVFHLSKRFPAEEKYSLTDQLRRSARSVTGNIAEAWQKRRYEASFVAKLTDSCAEAAETQDWLLYASSCGYADVETTEELCGRYEAILNTLHAMIDHAPSWCKRL